MIPIPAASVSATIIDRIRGVNANAASEIERIARLMRQGDETEAEFCKLCGLLFNYGEKEKAEELLLPNATEGDRLHSLYRHFFGGTAEATFDAAIHTFSKQFGVTLVRLRSHRLLSAVYSCSLIDGAAAVDQTIRPLCLRGCEVQITYEFGSSIVADVYLSEEDDRDSGIVAVPLQYTHEMWIKRTIL